jgi:CHAD domain-containing protein
MTPGLAGFVVSGEASVWSDRLDGVLAALQEAFEVAPERESARAGTRKRTWYDTFDWRLYRAGMLLEYVTEHRAGELVLTGPGCVGDSVNGSALSTGSDADGHAVQPVAGWRAARSYLAADLPDGPVTGRIADLVSPRALIPEVTVASTTTVTRLLNSDGKTVARLLIEQPAVGDEALPPRLAIAEVRGYPGQARRAARIVALAPGIVARGAEISPDTPGSRGPVAASPGGTLLMDALRVLGRAAGDYSNKVSAKITASMPAASATATIMLTLLDTLEANVDGVLRDTDSEFLHDLRVAVRRTRAAIKLLGDALQIPDEQAAWFAGEFKWLGDVTTPVRDLDVHLLEFDAMAAGLRAAKEDDLTPFRAFLSDRRAREFRVLARGLRSERFSQLMQDWRVTLSTVLTGRKRRAGATATKTASELAIERTRQALRKVSKRGNAITPDSPHESLHDLRKRCKELRYALEFFAPLHDKAAYAAVLGDLKRLQDCLGEFQDNEVQIDEIRMLAGAMQAAGAAPAATLLAMGEVTAGLAVRQQAARDAFEKRYAGFAGPEGQRHMTALLGAATPKGAGGAAAPGLSGATEGRGSAVREAVAQKPRRRPEGRGQ